MAHNSATVSKQTFYLTIFLVFIAGFLAGVVFTVFRTDDAPAGSPATTQGQQALPQQQADAILHLEAEVTAHPDNFDAWTQLGHLYFDTNQPEKAIGAYTKALELHSGSPDLWTDLGVMYRRSGDPAKAVESFDKAIAMDPAHLQSRFNKGVVLHFDLDRTEEALDAWRSVLALNNDYRMANNRLLREFIETVANETTN
ncbi:MAG: tetratricopeptide repeat protein [Desulfofustis sp.]|jgi:cytochrome c-type biogenesis protein CcmH/NrfG|nr:tetratricopeptide repeat protein [Desulfofustis sp.]